MLARCVEFVYASLQLMNVFEAASAALRDGRPAALVTVIGTKGSTPRDAGARMLIYGDGSSVGTIGGGAIERKAHQLAQEALDSGRPRRYFAEIDAAADMGCGGNMELYVEPLQVAPPLYLFGAGHVARAVAPLLRNAGFRVTVVDDRPELAQDDAFPNCVVRREDPVAFAKALQTDDNTHVLLMTHLHSRDQALLGAFLGRPHRFIGMLGSQVKVSRIFENLEKAGHSRETMAQVRAPVGLDIAAQTPFEIAVSVVAQLVAETRGATLPAVAMHRRELDG